MSRLNGRRHVAESIFKLLFLTKILPSLIKTSPKFVPDGPYENKPSLFLAMVLRWRQAITWTQDDIFNWRINASPDSMS